MKLEGLRRFGWGEAWEAERLRLGIDPSLVGRVRSDHRGGYRVAGEGWEALAVLAGRLRGAVKSREAQRPAVGDWVWLRKTAADDHERVIEGLFPRKSVLERKAVGKASETQVLCANVDIAFVVVALGHPINVRRIERFTSLARQGGVTPVVVLTKADVAGDAAGAAAALRETLPKVAVELVSAREGTGVDALLTYLRPTTTIVLVGASGAGKSTLINRWLGEGVRATLEVREDGKGRHATTHRAMFALPAGGVVVDTPGIREIGMTDLGAALDEAFEDVEVLASGCRFRDCRHEGEPGCALARAIAEGTIDADRARNYLTLRAEGAAFESRTEVAAQRRARASDKSASRALRKQLREKGRR